MTVPPSFEAFADIPDPIAGRAAEAPALATAPTEPSLTRTERARRLQLAAVAAVAWILALGVGLGLRDDPSSTATTIPFALMAVTAFASLFVAVLPGDRGLPRSTRVVQGLIGAVIAAFIALVIMTTTPELHVSAATEGGCLSVATLMTLVPLTLAALAFRGSFLSAPALRGAAIGAACGLGAAAGIHLHCGVLMRGHVLLAHGLPILLATSAGAIFGALRGRA